MGFILAGCSGEQDGFIFEGDEREVFVALGFGVYEVVCFVDEDGLLFLEVLECGERVGSGEPGVGVYLGFNAEDLGVGFPEWDECCGAEDGEWLV